VKSNFGAKASKFESFLFIVVSASLTSFFHSVVFLHINFVFRVNTVWMWSYVCRVDWGTLLTNQHCLNKQECVNIGTLYLRSNISFDQTQMSIIKCTVNIYPANYFIRYGIVCFEREIIPFRPTVVCSERAHVNLVPFCGVVTQIRMKWSVFLE
jgi:hypothetical protein